MKSLRGHLTGEHSLTTVCLRAAIAGGKTTPPAANTGHIRALYQSACCANGKHETLHTSRPSRQIPPLQSLGGRSASHRPLAPGSARMPRAIRTPQLNSRAPFSSQSATLAEPMIHDIFEPATGTWQYIVADPATCKAVIIDSVLDYDPATQAITTASADSLLDLVEKHGYQVDRILETHAHADHLTAASYLQRRLAERQGHKPSIGIGKRIDRVQTLFGHRYGVPAEEYQAVFDKLFDDDETFDIGNLQGTAIHLPGHTPDHLGYKIGDNVFCGDSLFHPDIGTARCDFPGGDASQLFRSARKLLDMPGHVRIWTGHDYPPEQGRDAVSYLTVDEHRARNKHLADGISEDEYVALRTARDKQMAAPRLLHPSLQINIRSGRLPKPTEAGQRLLHLPVKSDGVQW